MATHPKKAASPIVVRSPRPISRESVEASRLGVISKNHVQNARSRAESERESAKIADSLLSANIDIRQDRRISIVDAIHEGERPVQSYRRVQFLPCVQGPATKHFRDGLAAFLQANHKHACMMAVVKAGKISLSIYRDTHQAFAKAVNECSREIERQFGWTLQFANTENVISKNAMNGPQTDMHSHLYFTGPRLSKTNMKKLISFTQRCMQKRGFMYYCHISKVKAKHIDKAVRYAFYVNKRGSLADLLSPDELADFYRQSLRLRFFRPSGGFKKFLATLEPKKEIVDPSGVITQQKRVGRRTIAILDEQKGEMRWRITDRAQTNTSGQNRKTGSSGASDVILCIQLPSATWSERMTSGIVVKNYSGDFYGAVYNRGPEFEAAVNNRRSLYNAKVICDGCPDLVVPLLDFGQIRGLREEAASLMQAAADKMRIAAAIGHASAHGRAILAEAQVLEQMAAALHSRADALWQQLPRRSAPPVKANLISGPYSTLNPGSTPNHSAIPPSISQKQALQSGPP